mmetsp:Transcript_19342/g.39245  ORF Transcript_19342/g.39245 Transcript_19342/m.39245 type:complete len:89 (+) Transcript_19342:384-650(+)
MDVLHDAIFRGNSRLYEEMKRRTLEGREQYSCEIRSADPRQRRVAWHRVVSTWARSTPSCESSDVFQLVFEGEVGHCWSWLSARWISF